MMNSNFYWLPDITFCRGEKEDSEGNMTVCQLRDRCERYWSKEFIAEADKLGVAISCVSFAPLDGDIGSVEEGKCNIFWESHKK